VDVGKNGAVKQAGTMRYRRAEASCRGSRAVNTVVLVAPTAAEPPPNSGLAPRNVPAHSATKSKSLSISDTRSWFGWP
jgi:hypothetical protein